MATAAVDREFDDEGTLVVEQHFAIVPEWDAAEAASGRPADETGDQVDELARLEAVLAEADGDRVRVQRLAREQLAVAGEPVTRVAVARLACRLLDGDAAPTEGEGAA
jgi:hypothetical protein